MSLVVISVDTLRADHLTCYGYERPTTPSIDRLARQGLLFENAFSQSAKTATSHMTIMTGLYPAVHGVTNIRNGRARAPRAGIPTLASLLHDAGYRTEAYTAGANVHAKLGFSRGFDVYEHIMSQGRLFERAGAALEELAAGAGRAGSRPSSCSSIPTDPTIPTSPPPLSPTASSTPTTTGASFTRPTCWSIART